MKNLTKTLFNLDDFLTANGIEYVVTGTTALYLLGVPSDFVPQDIDIKVFHLKKEQANKLKELQLLSGFEDVNYPNCKCYSFQVNTSKINAIVQDTEEYSDIFSQVVTLDMRDRHEADCHIINIQSIKHAIKDKMRLKRDKDKTYMLNLIANLASL